MKPMETELAGEAPAKPDAGGIYAVVPVADMVGEKMNGKTSGRSSKWKTDIDECEACCTFYPVFTASNDFNSIAAHVGSRERLECCDMYWYRKSLFVKLCDCCGVRHKTRMIKVQYEQKHNLEHQEDSCMVDLCAPELRCRQILKEHHLRFGRPLKMVRS